LRSVKIVRQVTDIAVKNAEGVLTTEKGRASKIHLGLKLVKSIHILWMVIGVRALRLAKTNGFKDCEG